MPGSLYPGWFRIQVGGCLEGLKLFGLMSVFKCFFRFSGDVLRVER